MKVWIRSLVLLILISHCPLQAHSNVLWNVGKAVMGIACLAAIKYYFEENPGDRMARRIRESTEDGTLWDAVEFIPHEEGSLLGHDMIP